MSNLPNYSRWSRQSHIASLGMLCIAALALLAHFVLPSVVSIGLAQHAGIGLLGLFQVVVSFEAVRAGYFPGAGVYRGMYRGEKPIQFWSAVLLFGIIAPVACFAYGIFPVLGLLGLN